MIAYQVKVKKPWGYEIIFTPKSAPFCGKLLHVDGGFRLSLQYHDKKIESLCLIKGSATLTVATDSNQMIDIEMEPYKGYFIKAGQVHRITSAGGCDLVEASTPQTGETVRLEDDTGRKNEILS